MSEAAKSAKRYSDEDLTEFKALILQKIAEARKALISLKESLESSNDQSIGNTIRSVDDYSDFAEKEELILMMNRQAKFIKNLENALGRIANKSYGICRVTGNLIDKQRLRLVPHTTLSIEAKRRDY